MSNQQYLNSIKPGAIDGWHKYKIAPSITGAQAALESGWGSSKLAKPPYNNNFGIKASPDWTGRKISMSTQEYINGRWITINDDFRAYDTLSDSIADHSAFFTNTEWRKNNYREVVGQIDYKKAANALQKAGYATDPSYPQKLINIIEQYNLQSWDQEALRGETTNTNTPGSKKKVVGGNISSSARNGISQFTLSVIGDSLGVGTEPFLKQYPWAKQSYDNYGSRQWTHGTDIYNGITALNNMKNAGNLNNNVVFILGTNRGVDASEIDEAVSICGRDRNLILVDTTSEVNHRTRVSSEYEKAASRHDNVFYANWSSYSRANIGSWYYADGANGTRIHMNPTGYQKHADFIVQAVYEANQTIFEKSVTVDPIKAPTEGVNIYDIEYDDGVFTSPKGDSSIYNKALNDQLGFRARKGQIMWIERKYSGSETDSASLLDAAIEKMKEASVPAAQYTVSMRYLPDNISIGDTGIFVDHEFDPPLYIQARVLAMTTSESNPSSNTVTIGNVVEVTPQAKSDLLSIQQELKDNREISLAEYWKEKPITLHITTSNGLILKPQESEVFAQLVKKFQSEHVVKDGSLLVDMHKAKNTDATITVTGSIKDNYIDSVDEIVDNINYDEYDDVNFDDGPIDVNDNPQGQDVVDINDYNNIRKLIVDSFDIEFLNTSDEVVGSEKVYVYEDSTFVSKLINPKQHINKIRILSPRDCTFDNISAIDESIKLADAVESTNVSVKVFQEEKEVTHEFKNFSWSRVSQNTRLDNEWNDVNKWNESNSIDLDVKDIFGNESTFVCQMFDENGKFVAATSASVTITQEGNKNTVSDSTMPPINPSPGDKWTAIDGEIEKEYHYVNDEWQETGVSKKVEDAIAEAEQAKEDAQKAYQDAINEAERLVTEQDAVWQGKMEDYDEQVALIDASTKDAKTKAEQALTDAGISTDLAQTAKDLADTAKTNAQTAISNASQAVEDASTAVADASQAKANAQTALDNAQSALTEVGDAKTTANRLSVKVDDLEGEVELKATQTEVDGLSSTVSTHTTTLGQHATQIASKASSQLVNTIKGTVDTNTTEISQNAKEIASKASSSSVNTLTGRVSTAETNISQNATAITSKANQTEVDTVKGTVSSHTSTLSQHTSQISARLTNAQVNSLVDGKGYATQTYADTKITAKAGEITTSLTSLINTKATQSDINTSILNDKRIKDTRNDNQTPNWYNTNYSRQTVTEFKFTSAMGITGGSTYGLLTTEVVWNDASGGKIKQTLKDNTDTYTRQSNTAHTAWEPWVKMADQTYVNTTIKTTADGIEQLITNVKTNPTGTITGYNSLKNNVDSMVQAIGSDGGKIAQMVMTDSVYQTTVANLDIMARVGTGQQLYSDPLFVKGTNGISVYNNSGGTHVTITRESASGDPTPTNNRLKIVTNGSTVTPGWGGIIRYTTGRVKAEYVVMFTALLPKGRSFQYAQNPLGTGFTSKWLTSPDGTGDWAEYAYYYKCGTGSVSNFGHLYVHGGATPTTAAPLTWYLAKHETYDISGSFQTQVTQLADSWALTLKSGNDIKTQINASTNAIRLQSKFIHLNGSSLIDNATIKSAHIDSLNANKITGNTADFNTIRAGVLTTNAVSATHINGNTALFDKLFSTTSATSRLVAQGAWITNANIKSINASKITAGTISADRISTSSLANLEIGGTNLLKNSRTIPIYSNNNATYPASVTAMEENGRKFSRVRRTNPTLQPTVFSIYSTIAIGDINKSIFENDFTVVSFKARASQDVTMSMMQATYGGSPIVSGNLGHINITKEWKTFYSVFAKIPKTANGLRVNPLNTITSVNMSTFYLDVCEWKIEKGNKPTAWSPAPDDIRNDLGSSGKVEIHGGNIKANSLDVGKITGDKAKFLSLSFESLNSNMKLNSGAIRIQNSSGDFATMNTIPEFRSQDSAGTAAIMGKGRSHYYSGNQNRFYIGSNLEGLDQYGVHVGKNQTWGIYRPSDSYGGTPAQYYNTPTGWGAVQVVEELMRLGHVSSNFNTASAFIQNLNGWGNSWPVLQPGEPVMYKEAVAGNSSGVETLWSMGTSSAGVTRLYSHPEHVFGYRIEVRDRARFIAQALFENSFVNNSDRRIKHDIKDTEVTALDHLDSLTFKEYKLNSTGDKVPLGLIAQDSGILRVKGKDEGDYEGVDGLLMPMLAMKGVQELHAIVKEQAEKIKQLEEKINK